MEDLSIWDHDNPYCISVLATSSDIDSFGHVNNGVYIKWLEQLAWAHSTAVGLSEADCVAMSRGMAVRKINVEYLSACYAGDEVIVGNWISASDGKLRVTRRYQLIVPAKNITVMRGEVDFVCMNLQSGRPARFPARFTDAYQVTLSE
jgi:acyl-CoA thioester hydrolase